ncbi:MAG: response regulator, partial [bacterium]|nr:response regulator [bacterium]
MNAIYPDPSGDAVWFAGHKGIVRYDTTAQKNYRVNFPTQIREVEINRTPMFYDEENRGYIQSKNKDGLPTLFEYNNQNLRLRFSSPFFEAESQTQYQSLLKGYDDDWSPWSSERYRDYTNLDAGNYTFKVRAKNIYGNFSREATYEFGVKPHWSKTWWAYLIYIVALFLIMFLVIKWRSRKLAREKEKLENIVHQRTQEVEDQKYQLEEQSEKLKELDNAKSRFFANISHEFRTPLTLIMGPLEQMIAASPGDVEDKERKYTLMFRNSQRLLRLINQLLELSRLDSGKMVLQAGKTSIVPFVKGILSSFQMMAHQKELDLVFQSEYERENEAETVPLILYIDKRKMEDIMCNLLINAFKFTSPGGKIKVTVKGNTQPVQGCPEGWVEITVMDTGFGIPGEQLPYIFDRFFQGGNIYENQRKGSGIGLALCKELVELHHGTIEAQSREGEGSEFIIRLAMGKMHLEPGEIIDLPASELLSSSKLADEIPMLEMMMEKEETKKETGQDNGLLFESQTGADDTNIVLVVEDSADLRDYIREALEPGYIVIEAADGREGILKAQEIIPDLIISDVMMPEVSGFELCHQLKSDKNTSHIPIILLTAKASEENIVEGLETGADDYVTKPFST